MEYNRLGKSELKVSKLCFGSLTISPLQRNLSVTQSENILLHAFDHGVNFIDTAALYENYHQIKGALKQWGRHKIHIATKSYAYSEDTARRSLQEALTGLETDYIDLFMLHEQESEHTLRGHQEAIDFFLQKKKEGVIRSFGISTHFIEGVKAAANHGAMDVVHPIVNHQGLGIVDGDISGMLEAIKEAKQKDIGIFAMKPLGGGHFLSDFQKSFEYVLNLPDLDSIAVGMQSREEVEVNTGIFSKKEISHETIKKIQAQPRALQIADWCQGCGRCVNRCKMNALRLQGEEEKKRAVVDPRRCVFCGYCGKVCPDFCIKVI